MSELDTVGERLLGRPLEKEHRLGTLHYKPGQHQAEIVADEEALYATLSYVGAMGMAVLILCRKDDEGWKPTEISRQAMLETAWGAAKLPESFRFSKLMREALEDAERRYDERTEDGG